MHNLSTIVKRFLNIAFIVDTLWSVFVIFIGIISVFTASDENWSDWFTHGFLTAAAGYVALAVISYVFFGRVTFWYKSNT